MRLIAAAKAIAKRYWPPLSIRTILIATFIFVAALPGIGAVALRVYENTLVQQTEAELISQGAVLVAAYRAGWGDAEPIAAAPEPETPHIDLRVDPVLPSAHLPIKAGAADVRSIKIGGDLAPLAADASAVTAVAVTVMDPYGVVVLGHNLGLSHANLPEVQQAMAGQTTTTLRTRANDRYGLQSPLEWLSRAVTIRVHHTRPVMARGQVIGIVMLSRSPRDLFIGIYQDRGKIAFGVFAILLTLFVLAGLLSRGIAKPIRQLADASNDVSRGRVEIPETPPTAAIEIRDLYANFATMADRIEARERYLRDFAAAVSHEFKTPLAGIRGVLELLGEHEMDEAERQRFLSNAMADAKRLSHLVQRLLDLARADMTSAGSDSCDAVSATEQVIAGSHDVTVRSDGNVPQAAIEPETLASVLSILIDNSRQAGASRITIKISTENDRVLIRFADDGPGVPPADREKIFKPFFTSRRTSGGTGLGLSIARSLLSAVGASIALADTEKGAAFELRLLAQ